MVLFDSALMLMALCDGVKLCCYTENVTAIKLTIIVMIKLCFQLSVSSGGSYLLYHDDEKTIHEWLVHLKVAANDLSQVSSKPCWCFILIAGPASDHFIFFFLNCIIWVVWHHCVSWWEWCNFVHLSMFYCKCRTSDYCKSCLYKDVHAWYQDIFIVCMLKGIRKKVSFCISKNNRKMPVHSRWVSKLGLFGVLFCFVLFLFFYWYGEQCWLQLKHNVNLGKWELFIDVFISVGTFIQCGKCFV